MLNKTRATFKVYRCIHCGYKVETLTNHYGNYYDVCPKCSNENEDPLGAPLIRTWAFVEVVNAGGTDND